MSLSNEDLRTIVNYDTGKCLCGHFERCSVCLRSFQQREFERLAKKLASEILTQRDVKP